MHICLLNSQAPPTGPHDVPLSAGRLIMDCVLVPDRRAPVTSTTSVEEVDTSILSGVHAFPPSDDLQSLAPCDQDNVFEISKSHSVEKRRTRGYRRKNKL